MMAEPFDLWCEIEPATSPDLAKVRRQVENLKEEARLFSHPHVAAGESNFQVGLTTRLDGLPTWKRDADFLFAQVSFSMPDLVRWRDSICFGGPVYAGVIVLPSAPMARRLAAAVPQIRIPGELIDRVERDRLAGVDHACGLIVALRAAGGFSGVHLVPGVRYAAAAARLSAALPSATGRTVAYHTHECHPSGTVDPRPQTHGWARCEMPSAAASS